ncbi:MAG: NADH-quinone oxidoreductase subunit A [Candidatus Bathyarchaeia archaeon]
MAFQELSSPIVGFIIASLVTIIIYAIGGAIAPETSGSKDKLIPYACGENLPPEKTPIPIHVFDLAALFMVFDVVALVMVLSMGVSVYEEPIVLILALLYAALVFISLFVLARRR